MTATATAPASARPVPPARRSAIRWQLLAALGLATAGGLHVAAAVDHLSSGEAAVGFFLLTALVQAGLAAWLVLGAWAGTRAGAVPVALALIGTVGLVTLYVASYTTDLLDAFMATDAAVAGHHAGLRTDQTTFDPVTGVDFSTGVATRSGGPVAMDGPIAEATAGHGPKALGTAVVAAEVLTVAALAALLPTTRRRATLDALVVLAGVAWALWLTGVLG